MKHLGQVLSRGPGDEHSALLGAEVDTKWRSVFTPGTNRSRRMNSFPMLMNVLVPWVFFIFTFWVWAFRFHFTRGAWLTWVALCLAACCAVPFLQGEYAREKYTDPTWWRASCLLMSLSVLMGYVLGDLTYRTYMLTYYSYDALETYPQVDVGNELGVNLLDAGRVYFSSSAQILQSKSWHFKDGTLYCVAPIASSTGMKKSTYDFWAVGTDCCSEVAADFRCGEFENPRARAGLRLLDAGMLPNYRLAVNQAASQFGLHATTPLFFTWTQDPLNDISKLHESGYASFQMAVFGWLVLLVLAVTVMSFRFSLLGRTPRKAEEA